MAPCDNAVDTCANHFLINFLLSLLLIREKEAPSSGWGASEDGAKVAINSTRLILLCGRTQEETHPTLP